MWPVWYFIGCWNLTPHVHHCRHSIQTGLQSTYFSLGSYFQNHFQILPSARKHPNLKLRNSMGFPGASAGKESTCSAGDLGWEDPLERA